MDKTMKLNKHLVISGILLMIILITGYSFIFGKKPEPVNMTLEELSQFDGQEGRPAYVAVDGNIYDLTRCRYWKNGVHNQSPHNTIAGTDMTEVLKTSKHGIKRVQRYPLVGYLVESKD